MSMLRYVRFFEEFGIDDVPLVGGKNASLGEMFQKLSSEGVRVPNGFAITAEAYRYMLDKAGAWDHLHAELDELDPTDVAALARKGKRAREIVYAPNSQTTWRQRLWTRTGGFSMSTARM